MNNNALDIYAEQGLIFGIISNPEYIEEVSSFLNENDFKDPKHSILFTAIKNIKMLGKPISVINLASHLRNNSLLETVGGVGFITDFFNPEAPYAMYADPLSYGMIVLEESKKRQTYRILNDSIEATRLDSGVNSDQIISTISNDLRELSERSSSSKKINKVSDAMDSVLKDIQEKAATGQTIHGVPTGFNDLDAFTTGLLPGQFVIIAGRPSEGKSTLGVDIMRAASIRAGKASLIFSLEMSEDEIIKRMLSAESNVPFSNIKTGKLSSEEWNDLHEARAEMDAANIFIEDTADITIDYIRHKSLEQASKPEGLDLIIVDYLQLMRSNGRVESRQQEVSVFSRSLKLLAKEIGVPVIGISQLNRGPENRTTKKPALSDLRESGSLEQDADIVILIWRHSEEGENKTSLILAKNRNGQRDITIPIVPLLEYAKFVNGTGMFPPDNPEESPTHPSDEQYYATQDSYTPEPVDAGAAW